MVAKLAEVDVYVRKAAPSAPPILKHFRALVHAQRPDASEAIKWGFPHFEAFSAGTRNDCIDWIPEAKQAATREWRLATMLEWLADGKSRNWQYMTSRKAGAKA